VDAATMLRTARREAGLTQRELARRAGVPQPTVARIEARTVVPRLDTLDVLLAVCGKQLDLRPRPGIGIDRGPIRALLALSPGQRLRLAAREARNLDRFLTGAPGR
jgi:transcriptional regulator with XRE-family HTH domain